MEKLTVGEANYLILTLQQQINRYGVMSITMQDEGKAEVELENNKCKIIIKKLEKAISNSEISL